jgi:hypothetical protein
MSHDRDHENNHKTHKKIDKKITDNEKNKKHYTDSSSEED